MNELHLAAWNSALQHGAQLWYEHLERVQVCDAVAFAFDHQATEDLGALGLADLLRRHLIPEHRVDSPGLSEPMKLLRLTIERLGDHIRSVLERAFDEQNVRNIPREGVLQYFGDDLRFCLYLQYRSGSVAQLLEVVPLLDPLLIADPIQLMKEA